MLPPNGEFSSKPSPDGIQRNSGLWRLDTCDLIDELPPKSRPFGSSVSKKEEPDEPNLNVPHNAELAQARRLGMRQSHHCAGTDMVLMPRHLPASPQMQRATPVDGGRGERCRVQVPVRPAGRGLAAD